MYRLSSPDTGYGQNLYEWVEKRVGDADAASEVVTFITQWDHLRDERAGDDPSLDDFAQRWQMSRQDAARGLGLFRLAFPDAETPGGIVGGLDPVHERGSEILRSLTVNEIA